MSETQVKLTKVKSSFLKIFKPSSFKKNDGSMSNPKYSGSFLINASTEEGANLLKKVKAAAKKAIDARWADKTPKFKEDHKAIFLAEDKEIYEDIQEQCGEGEWWVVKASDRNSPVIVDRSRRPINETEAMEKDILQSGDIVNAVIDFWTYSNDAKGFAANLRAIQFVERSERFGGGAAVKADDVFDDLGGDEDAWDDDDL